MTPEARLIAQAEDEATVLDLKGPARDAFVKHYLALLAVGGAKATSQGYLRVGPPPPVEPKEAKELPSPTELNGEA